MKLENHPPATSHKQKLISCSRQMGTTVQCVKACILYDFGAIPVGGIGFRVHCEPVCPCVEHSTSFNLDQGEILYVIVNDSNTVD